MVLSSSPPPSPALPALGPPLRGDAGYRRLVRLLARSFYGGECPPAPPAAAPSPVPRRGAVPSTVGLGTVLLDQLSRPGAAWVDEGALSASLRLAPKHVRRALRHLQAQRVVDSAVLRYSFARTDSEGAPLTDDPSLARKRLETRTYWRVDHARLKDAVRLKLHRLRERVRRAVDAGTEVQRYRCARCGASFSSLDAPRLLHAASGTFRCLECSAELQEAAEEESEEQGFEGTSETLVPPAPPGSASSRQGAARSLAQRLEAQLAPLTEQLAAIKEDAPPDQGPFQQWFTEQHRAARAAQDRREAARARAAAGGAAARAGDAEAMLLDENAAVLVALEEGGAAAGEAGAAQAPKETPLWFRRERGARADEDGQSAGVVDAEAERRRLEAAYLAQYMEAVRAAAGGAGADAGAGQEGGFKLEDEGIELEDEGIKLEDEGIKLEDKGLELEDKGLKLEEERPHLEEQGLELEEVKPETALAVEDEDDEAWEDA